MQATKKIQFPQSILVQPAENLFKTTFLYVSVVKNQFKKISIRASKNSSWKSKNSIWKC